MIAKTFNWVAASKKRQWALAVMALPLVYFAGELGHAIGYWSVQPIG